ncbi:TCP11 family protein [Megaselia abdita]
MDSSDSPPSAEATTSDQLLSSSPDAISIRSRTSSEGSDKQARFVLPSTDGSPPKVLTLNEIYSVVKNIQNMTLAHEIALNPEFKLEPYQPPENSLERKIKDIMHKAYWDVLREDLNSTPPKYTHAIQLLSEIKECFPQILVSNNQSQKVLDHINEILDEAVIAQQAEKNVLDFKSYATFVIDVMGKFCAPARDDEIKKLREIEDVVETFRGILDVMSLMKLDMANFLLNFARNDILANSVEYEKEKFKEYLEYYKFGFPITENWLKRNQTKLENGTTSKPEQTIFNAFMELLNWDAVDEFPEVLSNDKERFLKLSQRVLRICGCATATAICSGISILNQKDDLRSSLIKQFAIILQNVTTHDELVDCMENVALQVIEVINTYLKENESDPTPVALSEVEENTIKTQIIQASKKESPVYNLMWKRLQTFVHFYVRSKNGSPPPPPGFMDYAEELESIAHAFKRVVVYNHSIFTDYFSQVLRKEAAQCEGAVGGSVGAAGVSGKPISGVLPPNPKPSPNVGNE